MLQKAKGKKLPQIAPYTNQCFQKTQKILTSIRLIGLLERSWEIASSVLLVVSPNRETHSIRMQRNFSIVLVQYSLKNKKVGQGSTVYAWCWFHNSVISILYIIYRIPVILQKITRQESRSTSNITIKKEKRSSSNSRQVPWTALYLINKIVVHCVKIVFIRKVLWRI